MPDWWSRATVVQKFDELTTKHPTLIKKETVGKSHLGSDVPMYRIGTNTAVKILWDGCIHGYSAWSSHTLYNLAKWLLEDNSTEAKSALRRLQTIIVPMMNYDKYAVARKNANGVDLNRNFVSGWGTSGSGDPASEYYRGVSAASEKETQFMRTLYNKEKPKVYFNLHVYGGSEELRGSIMKLGYTGTAHVNKATEIINKFKQLCTQHSILIPYCSSSYSSPSAYAVNDCYSLAGSYCFLFEQSGVDNPTLEDVNGFMSTRLQLLEIAVDELFGVEPPTPEEVLSANIGATFGLIIIIPYITTYSREVIRQWKKQTYRT